MGSMSAHSGCDGPLRRLALGAALAAGLSACASTQTEPWQPMPADEARLVLYAPGLDTPRVHFERRTEGIKTFERGHWRPEAGAFPEAELVLLAFTDAAPSGMSWVREPDLEQRIRRWLATDSVEMGRGGVDRNALGEVEYLRFTRNGVTECVFMRQYGDTFADQRPPEHHGGLMIRGYYCLAPGEPLSQGTVHRVLAGIGLAGYEVPPRPRDLSLPGGAQAGAEASVQRRSIRGNAFPYAVRFTSAVYTTAEGHEIADEFDEIGVEDGRFYLFVKWRGLTAEPHVARLRIFDGAGRQIDSSDYAFTPRSARWNNWWPYTPDPDRDAPGDWRFEVDLDGELLVERHLLVTAVGFGSPRSGTSADGRESAFDEYSNFQESSRYKAFVRNDETAWAWRSGKTFYTAMGEAMGACQERSRDANQSPTCRLYAVGDEIVWNLSGAKRREVIEAYSR